jgi:hypothetical protein
MAFSMEALEKARKSGYTDDEIYGHLAQSDSRFAKAKEAGYSLDAVAKHLTPAPASVSGGPSTMDRIKSAANAAYQQTPLPDLAHLGAQMIGQEPINLANTGGALGRTALHGVSALLAPELYVPSVIASAGTAAGVENTALPSWMKAVLPMAAGVGAGKFTLPTAQSANMARGIVRSSELPNSAKSAMESLIPYRPLAAAPTTRELPVGTFGKLSPAQQQIAQGLKGVTPEMEREAMGRSSNPIQELARKQAESFEGNLGKTLQSAGKIQDPTTAASLFQGKFESAQEAASNAMRSIDDMIAKADASKVTQVNPVTVKQSIIDAVREAGWKVNDKGKIQTDLTAKGFSAPAASVMQKYIDAVGKAKSVTDLRNLRQNFGQEIYKAGQDSGVPSNIIRNSVYGALSGAEQSALPAPLARALKANNAKYAGLKSAEDVALLGKPLEKDPIKFWDSLLTSAQNDKDFSNKLTKFGEQTGIKPDELRSVAVSNISDKVRSALNAPSHDDIGRLTSAVSVLEKEMNRIPANSREALLGDSYHKLKGIVAEGRTVREWASKLPNGSETARNIIPQMLDKIGNVADAVIPYGVGKMAGNVIRKASSAASDASMERYLNQPPQAKDDLKYLKLLGLTPSVTQATR